MQLSIRLNAVATMVTKGNRLVEAGCDHGYMPIFLVENEIVPSAIAMDINKGPLERAKAHINEHKLGEKIETRLSDGVQALKKGEGDSLIIAGMGGGLVIKILTEGREILSEFKEFILQPQSELTQVRKYLQNNNYEIVEERMVIDEGKYYPMFKVVHGHMEYDREIYFKYGKFLLEEKNEVLREFLLKEKNIYNNVLKQLMDAGEDKENISNRKFEVEKELEYIEEALEFYE